MGLSVDRGSSSTVTGVRLSPCSGQSVAGSFLSRALEGSLPSTHRIILVDSNEFAFYPVSSLRSAVAPGQYHHPYPPIRGPIPLGSTAGS